MPPYPFSFSILNSDLAFPCKSLHLINGTLFLITPSNEILALQKKEDSANNVSFFKKRFCVLSEKREREEIRFLFRIRYVDLVGGNGKAIVGITDKLTIIAFSPSDGMCLSKLSLSFLNENQLLDAFEIYGRFLILFFSRRTLVFDFFAKEIVRDEPFQVIKNSNELENHILEEENNPSNNIAKYKEKKEEKKVESKYENFTIQKVYKIKENKFFLKTTKNETYFLHFVGFDKIDDYSIDYEKTEIKMFKQNFNLNYFFNDDNLTCLFNNEEFMLFTNGNELKVCFLDSVDELTEISSLKNKSKFPFIYVGKLGNILGRKNSINKIDNHINNVSNSINLDNRNVNNNIVDKDNNKGNILEKGKDDKSNINDNLIVIYKDLTVEIYEYNKKVRELVLINKFTLMVEDKYLNMRYITEDNLIIGYTRNEILTFDLRISLIRDEKYSDSIINLLDPFEKANKKIFFSNYFMINFPSYIRDLLYYINNSKPFRITCSLIYFNPEYGSIYYIAGSENGKVIIIDMFMTENMKLNPVLVLDVHKAPISSICILPGNRLAVGGQGGLISIADFSWAELEKMLHSIELGSEFEDPGLRNMIREEFGSIKRGIDEVNKAYNVYSKKRKRKSSSISSGQELKKSTNSKGQQIGSFFPICITPQMTLKSYGPLKNILPVIRLDVLYICDEATKEKIDSMVAFVTMENEAIIVRNDSLIEMYRFNQAKKKTSIEGVYLVESQKALIFYLSNDTIKICSYATRTCDRTISNINKISEILRVEETLSNFFMKDARLSEYVTNNNKESLYFDKSKLSEKNNNYQYKKNEDITILTIKSILYSISDSEDLRLLFVSKLFETASEKKQKLCPSQNRFEATYMRKISDSVIGRIIQILNENISDILMKIRIANLIRNPEAFCQISQNRTQNENYGISGKCINFGGQNCQTIEIDFEEYFKSMENKVKSLDNKKDKKNKKEKENLFNILSFFHIWNFSLDLDKELLDYYKLSQPIFDIHPILIGNSSVYSIILSDEIDIDYNNSMTDKFTDHLKYFCQNYQIINKNQKEQSKNLFTNRASLLETMQGFLVNLKNYKLSENLSHIMNIGLFGSLVALLGHKENSQLANFIHKEKKVMRVLAHKKQIKFSDFGIINKLLFADNSNLMIANKNLILDEHIQIQYNMCKNEKNVIVTNLEFKKTRDRIENYLKKVYKYVIESHIREKNISFSELKRELNLEAGFKTCFLTEYELALINMLLSYHFYININNKNSHDDLSNNTLIQLTELLVCFVFKLVNEQNLNIAESNVLLELLDKSQETLSKIYERHYQNYILFILQYYCSFKQEINLNSSFKRHTIDKDLIIIKSDENENFMKIILAKHIKSLVKTKINLVLKIIFDEFKKPRNKDDNLSYYSFLMEILFIIFKDKSIKLIEFLTPIVTHIMNLMNPVNKDIKSVCIDCSRNILSKLICHYPMIAFHLNTQKLAVGSIEGKITIYDITTGSVWKNLSAHNSKIDALIFDTSGNSIVSYSSHEAIIKAFKISLANFFGNFFSMKEYKSKKLNVINQQISEEKKLETVRFVIASKKGDKITLQREDGKTTDFSI